MVIIPWELTVQCCGVLSYCSVSPHRNKRDKWLKLPWGRKTEDSSPADQDLHVKF